ncbi:hypothetical protein BCV71DRAFT_274273 [Rhizopus microsporus]|uniref:Uncharacterized protein n=1 Tax=Rhizopus microsporus TaxID=58291 RepID=A0A1X0RT07_RHIZD|nr:hypothetical protein BCV71DRAFT_274273 [Rhizopus microsporus]
MLKVDPKANSAAYISQLFRLRPLGFGCMDKECTHCYSLHWIDERQETPSLRNPSWKSCCKQGSVQLGAQGRRFNNISIAASKRRVHAVLKSKSCTVWNCDVNSALNIYNIFVYKLKHDNESLQRLTVLPGFNALSITAVHSLTPRTAAIAKRRSFLEHNPDSGRHLFFNLATQNRFYRKRNNSERREEEKEDRENEVLYSY